MTHDARGVPVSCASPTPLGLYETALAQYQSYVGDPIAAIEAALEEAPDFVLGHLCVSVAARGPAPRLRVRKVSETGRR